MKRGGFLQRKPKVKRPASLVPKATGQRLVKKGPSRSAAWLDHIRSLPCLCCPIGRQEGRSRAHHPRGLFPRTMGVRVSDLLCLPLCDAHHTSGPDALHRNGDELRWWQARGVDPYGCILSCLMACKEPEREEARAFVKLHRDIKFMTTTKD